MSARARLTALTAAAALVVSGCGVTVEDLPLPGGEVEGPTYQLKAVFTDALNLPGKAKVRLGGVDVGIVDSISTRDYVAHVEMSISTEVRLPKGTTAELRQPTPLGDVFVSVEPPNGKLAGPKLADGATIGLTHTSSAATVEDSLAAATLLINGGGLGRMKTITRELNDMFATGGERIPHLLGELRTLVRTLNERTADIDRVLKATNSVSKTISKRTGSIDKMLKEFPPAFDVLSRQTKKLTSTLAKVGTAGGKTVSMLNASKADLAAILRDLGPVLDGFGKIKGTLGPNLRELVALGKLVEHATEAESAAGSLTISGVDYLPIVGGGVFPGQEDLERQVTSITDNLMELLQRLGGTS